ncbi:hypothetical protein AU377_14710 [Sporosarcina sp. HYO08]|nr:hypothetical protein AU377_14710 [Sporosarcina sp. HYO08]
MIVSSSFSSSSDKIHVGLGLPEKYLVQLLTDNPSIPIDRMKGKIEVTSQTGTGTTFKIYVPLREE